MILHATIECGVKKGNANSGALIFCKTTFDLLAIDFTDELKWNSAMGIGGLVTVNANPEDIIILNNISITRTSDFKTIENPISDGHEELYDGTTFTVTIIDPNVSEDNHEIYGKLLQDRRAYVVMAFNDGSMEVSEMMFKIKGKLPNAEKDAVQTYTATGKRTFANSKTWLRFTTQPDGIFDLFD
jgi:hypothetical protein